MSLNAAKSILILVAMDVELNAILKEISFHRLPSMHRFPLEVFHHAAGDNHVYLAKSGVGVVNASIVTVLCHESFGLNGVVCLGVGGALSHTLRTGDLVIATQIIAHDCFVSYPNNVIELMSPGELHLSLSETARPKVELVCDIDLRSKCFTSESKLDNKFSSIEGTVVSGNEFVSCPKRKAALAQQHSAALAQQHSAALAQQHSAALAQQHSAVLVEMEGAGIGLAAKRIGIPFCLFKTVADEAAPKEANIHNQYVDFLEASAAHAAQIAKSLIQNLCG